MHARDPKERVESWEPHVRYPILVNGVKICDYEIDSWFDTPMAARSSSR
jgi:hypothetical protein